MGASVDPDISSAEPSSAAVSPISTRARVVFPLPDSPTRPSVSPVRRSRSMPVRACTGSLPPVKVLDTPRSEMTGAEASSGGGSRTSSGVARGSSAACSW